MKIPAMSDIDDAFKGKAWHFLLLLMVIFFFVSGAVKTHDLCLKVIMEVGFWTLFCGLAVHCESPKRLKIAICLLIAAALSTGLLSQIVYPGHITFTTIHRSLSFSANILISFELLRALFTLEHATWSTVSRAVCSYLALASAWTNAFSLALFLVPGTIHHLLDGGAMVAIPSGNLIDMNELFYFSVCTLTSVGYGDIVPTGSWTRMMAGAEAIMGQFFMAVVLARIVGLHLSGRRK